MKRDQIQALFFFVTLGVIVAGLLSQRTPQSIITAQNQANFHEIMGEDTWAQQGAAQNQGGAFYYAPGNGPNMPMAQNPVAQVALTQQGPAIMQGQQPPVLIKQMGMEVVEVTGGKVKVTGVMGGSWADKGGLKAGDIILRFDNKSITSLEEFKTLTAKAAPEKDYMVKYLRNGVSQKTMVTIGEGEMEGFLPIVRTPTVPAAAPVAFRNVMVQKHGGICIFQCPHCGTRITAPPLSGGLNGQICPMCGCVMQEIK